MRVAPTPLYTFIDVLMFFKQLEQILQPTTYIAILYFISNIALDMHGLCLRLLRVVTVLC